MSINDYHKPDHLNLIMPLINWGRCHLIHESEQEKDFFQSAFLVSRNESPDPSGELHAGLKSLGQAVERALVDLASDKTLGIEAEYFPFTPFQDDEDWEEEDLELTEEEQVLHDIAAACDCFDDAVFLLVAVKDFPFPDEQVRPELIAMLQALVDKIHQPEQIPTCRLIPLNKGRLQRLETIPDHARYLFPWYEEWSDVPADILDVVAEVIAGQIPEEYPAMDRIFELRVEIENDPPLYEAILTEAVFIHELADAVENNYSLIWRERAEQEASERPLPEKIGMLGGLNASMLLIAKDMLAKVAKEAWLFRAAACGIGFTPQDRLRLFSQVENSLKSMDISPEGNPLLNDLVRWQAGSCSDQELFDPLFDHWHDDLRELATEGVYLDYTRGDFLALLDESATRQNELLDQIKSLITHQEDPTPDEPIHWWNDYIHDPAAQAQQKIEVPYMSGVYAGGSLAEDKQWAKLSLHAYHRIPQPPDGDLVLFAEADNAAEYKEDREKILACQEFFWMALYTSPANELRTLGPERADMLSRCKTITAGSWQGPVFLLIAGRQDVLEKSKATLDPKNMKQFQACLTAGEVVVIEYTPPAG
jgi:hypothetical protein